MSDENVYLQVGERYARRAKGSGADHWTTKYIEQCRKGEREPLFTPRPPDPGQSGAPSGGGGGGLLSSLGALLTFQ